MRQCEVTCVPFHFRHRIRLIFNRVLTSDEQLILYDTPRLSKHWLKPQDAIPHDARPTMHLHKLCFASGGHVVKIFTMSYYQWSKR